MKAYYNNCSISSECAPNLEGTWNLIGTIFPRKNKMEQPDFKDIEVRIFKEEVTQRGVFLVFKEDTRARMGVLTLMNSIWTLKIVDDDDNGVITLVPKIRGDYTCWVGNYAEPGFDDRPEQSQTVATVELKKLNVHHCCCQK